MNFMQICFYSSQKGSNLFSNYQQSDDYICVTMCVMWIYVAFISAELSCVHPSGKQTRPKVIVVLRELTS